MSRLPLANSISVPWISDDVVSGNFRVSTLHSFIDMDTHHMSHVPFAKFYVNALDVERPFEKSVSYLREHRALKCS